VTGTANAKSDATVNSKMLLTRFITACLTTDPTGAFNRTACHRRK
jgi:hypothetical protein